jgi:hypothetical protein
MQFIENLNFNYIYNFFLPPQLRVRIGAEFPLVEAAAAHDLLCGRGSVGKILLTL